MSEGHFLVWTVGGRGAFFLVNQVSQMKVNVKKHGMDIKIRNTMGCLREEQKQAGTFVVWTVGGRGPFS